MTELPVPADAAPVGPRPSGLDDERLLRLYLSMARIREFEEEVVEAASRGLVPGPAHPCIGQEAVKVGAVAALAPGDLVFGSHRGHGEALALGLDRGAIMAEILGRASGLSQGRGGSPRLSEPGSGLVWTSPVPAGQIPMAGGAALGCQIRRTGQVVLCLFGDGAATQGVFYETLSLASLWRLPLILVCENNGYAGSVPAAGAQSTNAIAERGRSFGVLAFQVDGNDVLAVRAAVSDAAERARAEQGPTLIECRTLRWERHSTESPDEEGQAARRAARERVDPLRRYRRQLIGWRLIAEPGLQQIDQKAEDDAVAAKQAAEAAPVTSAIPTEADLFA